MIQLRQIYEFTPKGEDQPIKSDRPLTPDIVFNSMPDMISSIGDAIRGIPESERTNIFCTVHEQPEDAEKRKKKVWIKQKHLLFDIDGVGDERNPGADALYRETLSEVLRIPPDNILQIFSGHGYHFIVELSDYIDDKSYFTKNRLFFQVLCAKLTESLKAAGLKGVADHEVFAPNRLLRCPHTYNKKKDLVAVPVELIHGGLSPVTLNLQELSGLPSVDLKEQLSEKDMSYIKTDSGSVLGGCNFLKWTKANQADVNESQWYAMLSIVGRVAGADKLIHAYSKDHPSYNARATERKTEQALKNSGPRTCNSINSLWDGCKKCPNFKKVQSPIMIKGEGFIATGHAGFHMLARNGKLVPQYGDLQRFYNTEIPYTNVKKSHYQYNGKFWDEREDIVIDSFAQKHFKPAANNTKCSEFRGLIKRTNLGIQEWFGNSTKGKLNLLNGVLDTSTHKLHKHSTDFGFTHVLPYEYVPGATAPTFEKMLANVTVDRPELKQILLEYMGYCLSNDSPRAQKILVLSGEGQNGKSYFLNVLQALGGPGATALGVRDLNNAFHMQQLDGALFNITEEVPSFTHRDTWELIKGLVTGASVTASRKFKSPYIFRNRAKFIMTCNELPKGANPNHGFFRRLLVVPFEARFSRELGNVDINIDDRIIKNELPGVLNMVLKAYADFKEREFTFTQSDAVDSAVKEYRMEMDSVRTFVDDTIEVGTPGLDTGGAPDFFKMHSGSPVLVMDEYYESYREFCDKMGSKALGFNTFSRRVGDALNIGKSYPVANVVGHGVLKGRAVIGGVRRRFLQGVKWLAV